MYRQIGCHIFITTIWELELQPMLVLYAYNTNFDFQVIELCVRLCYATFQTQNLHFNVQIIEEKRIDDQLCV